MRRHRHRHLIAAICLNHYPLLKLAPTTLMAAADRALDQAKAQGGDRLVFQDEISPAV